MPPKKPSTPLDTPPSLYERLLGLLLSHRLVAIVAVVGTITIGLAAFTDAISGLYRQLSHMVSGSAHTSRESIQKKRMLFVVTLDPINHSNSCDLVDYKGDFYIDAAQPIALKCVSQSCQRLAGSIAQATRPS
jgi:hypothetical protein